MILAFSEGKTVDERMANHPLDSHGSAYDDVFNDLSTAGSVYSAQQQQQQQQLQAQQVQILQLQQQLQSHNSNGATSSNGAGNSNEQRLRNAISAGNPSASSSSSSSQHVHQHHLAHVNSSRPRSSMTQSMILPTTMSAHGGNHAGLGGGGSTTNPLSAMTHSFNPSQLQFSAAGGLSAADIASALTPVGHHGGNASGASGPGGDFLSQLGKTWNLIQSKAQELDAAKRKHRRVAKALNDATAELENLRHRDGVVALRVSELESNALVLTSENARVRKELQLVRDAQSSLESRALAAETELAEKQNDHAHLVREHAEQQTALDALRSKERAHAADNEDLRAQLERARARADESDARAAKASESTQQTVADLHREKSELSTHLWHVMEELKASERRANELEEGVAEKTQALERRAAEVTQLSGEKRDVEQAFASLKSEVSETLGAMQREHSATSEQLRASKAENAREKKAVASLKREISEARADADDARKEGAAQIKQLREEANRAASDAESLLRAATEEGAESLRTAKDALGRATRSREQLQEALDAKREELRAARDETSATRRRCTEMEAKNERLAADHREKMDGVQAALRGREDELGKTRAALAASEDRARLAEDKAQAGLAAKVEQACVEAEERLGAEIAALNRSLNDEAQARGAAEKERDECKAGLEEVRAHFSEQRKGL